MVCYCIKYKVYSIVTQAARGAAALAGVGAGSGTPEATFVSKLPKLRSTWKTQHMKILLNIWQSNDLLTHIDWFGRLLTTIHLLKFRYSWLVDNRGWAHGGSDEKGCLARRCKASSLWGSDEEDCWLPCWFKASCLQRSEPHAWEFDSDWLLKLITICFSVSHLCSNLWTLRSRTNT